MENIVSHIQARRSSGAESHRGRFRNAVCVNIIYMNPKIHALNKVVPRLLYNIIILRDKLLKIKNLASEKLKAVSPMPKKVVGAIKTKKTKITKTADG